MAETYYKVLNEKGRCFHGGHGVWLLPSPTGPGEWMPELTGPLRPCEYGYHILRGQDLVYWLGPKIYSLEAQEPVIWDGDKGVCHTARLLAEMERWNQRTATLLAADYVEHVLPLYESVFPDDDRPRKAIQAARDYTNGLIDLDTLRKIDDAAASAARVAWAAEAAWAARAARAAWAAGTARASSADWVATRIVDRAAEGKWQTERLFQYLDGTR